MRTGKPTTEAEAVLRGGQACRWLAIEPQPAQLHGADDGRR